MLKLFITLKDTTINHGPLHILDLPNTRSALKNGYKSRRNYGFNMTKWKIMLLS